MNLPNKLTILRVILIPFFVVSLLVPLFGYGPCEGPAKWIALGIFIVASFTDFLDGKIARKYNLVTNFGKFMDPLADKLLVCSALICMVDLGRIEGYIVLIIISREFTISGFRLVAADNGVVIAASYFGKVKTVMQILLVCLLIVDFECLSVVTIVVKYLALALTIISLADYLWKNRKVMGETK